MDANRLMGARSRIRRTRAETGTSCAQVIRFGAEQLLLATWTGSVAGGGKEPVVPASVDPVLRACIQAQAANHRQDDRHDEVKTRECQPIDGFQIESCG